MNDATQTRMRTEPVTPAALVVAELSETVRLALPLALTQLGQIVMLTTDLALIGRLGDEYLAAAALAHTVLFAAFVVGMGMVSAVAPLAAQAFGAGDDRMVRRSLRVGIYVSVLLGFPLGFAQLFAEPILIALGQPPDAIDGAADYLVSLGWSIIPAWIFIAFRSFMSAVGAPAPALWIMLAAIPVNFALAYLLIFGGLGIPALGLIGAGIATTLVNCVMCAAAAAVTIFMQPFRQYGALDRLWRPDWQLLWRLMRIGTPISIAFSLEHGLFMAATLLAGAIGTVALASHQIALQVATIAFMLPLGIGLAASVRVGQAVGKRDIAAARRAGFTALGLGATVTGTMMLVVFVANHWLPALFLGAETAEVEATYDLAATLLLFAAAFFVVDGSQSIAAGSLRGFNDTKVPMIYAGVSFWAIGFPISWVLAFPAGLDAPGIWYGLCVGLAVFAGLLIRRFERRSRPHPRTDQVRPLIA